MSEFLRLVGLPSFAGLGAYTFYKVFKTTVIAHNKRDFQLSDENGNGVPVPSEITSIYKEIIQKLDWEPYILANIQFIICKGQELAHLGMIRGRNGTFIGIPQRFTYKHPDDFKNDIEKICEFYNIPIDRSNDVSKELIDALLLSEQAKKFGVAREVMMANSYQDFSQLIFMSTNLFLGYTLFYYSDKYFKSKPIMRLCVYVLGGLSLCKIYLDSMDFYTQRLEQHVDKKAVEIGPNFAQGAEEFYDKCILLRDLVKPYEKEVGEFKKFLQDLQRNRHLTLEERKRILVDHVNSLEPGKETDKSKVFVGNLFNKIEKFSSNPPKPS